jgi:hypothetical protein
VLGGPRCEPSAAVPMLVHAAPFVSRGVLLCSAAGTCGGLLLPAENGTSRLSHAPTDTLANGHSHRSLGHRPRTHDFGVNPTYSSWKTRCFCGIGATARAAAQSTVLSSAAVEIRANGFQCSQLLAGKSHGFPVCAELTLRNQHRRHRCSRRLD